MIVFVLSQPGDVLSVNVNVNTKFIWRDFMQHHNTSLLNTLISDEQRCL